MPFELYREQYVSPARLGFRKHWIDAPHMASQPAAL
jgi:glutamate--cysteine ligase